MTEMRRKCFKKIVPVIMAAVFSFGQSAAPALAQEVNQNILTGTQLENQTPTTSPGNAPTNENNARTPAGNSTFNSLAPSALSPPETNPETEPEPVVNIPAALSISAPPPKLIEPVVTPPSVNLNETMLVKTQEAGTAYSPPDIPEVPEEGIQTFNDQGILTYDKVKYSSESDGYLSTTVYESRWNSKGELTGSTSESWIKPAAAAHGRDLDPRYAGSDSQYYKSSYQCTGSVCTVSTKTVTYDSKNSSNIHSTSESDSFDDGIHGRPQNYTASESVNWYTKLVEVDRQRTTYTTELLEKWSRSASTMEDFMNEQRRDGYRWTLSKSVDKFHKEINIVMDDENFHSDGSGSHSTWNEEVHILSASTMTVNSENNREVRLHKSEWNRVGVTLSKSKSYSETRSVKKVEDLLETEDRKFIEDWHNDSETAVSEGYQISSITDEVEGDWQTTKRYFFGGTKLYFVEISDQVGFGVIKSHSYVKSNFDPRDLSGNITIVATETNPMSYERGYSLMEKQWNDRGEPVMDLIRSATQSLKLDSTSVVDGGPPVLSFSGKANVSLDNFITGESYRRSASYRGHKLSVAIYQGHDLGPLEIGNLSAHFDLETNLTGDSSEKMTGSTGASLGEIEKNSSGVYTAYQKDLARQWIDKLHGLAEFENNYFGNSSPLQSLMAWLQGIVDAPQAP